MIIQIDKDAIPRPLRILVYGLNFAPEMTGVGKYTAEMVYWLAERGHDVRVVSSYPYYPDWEIKKPYVPWRYSREPMLGADIWRSPIWVPKQPSGTTRLVHLASFAASSLPALAAQTVWSPEVVITIAPTLFCALSGWAFARSIGALCCLHIQDFEVDAAFDLGVLNRPTLRRTLLNVERKLLERFDLLTTISPRMLEGLKAKGVSESKVSLLTNWVDCKDIYPLTTKTNRYRKELGLRAEIKVAMYSGALGQKQGFATLVDAAKRLADRKDLLFVFASAGAQSRHFQAQTKGLKNVRWLPLQPEDQLNEWLNFADIHLLPQRADAADLVMPSKLMGMLASGKPVVAMAEPGTQLADVVAGCGIVVAPESVDELVAAIAKLASDTPLRAQLGKAARRQALSDYERTAVLSRFESKLMSMLPDSAPIPSRPNSKRPLRPNPSAL